MSRRMFPRFALAALLAGVVAATAVAQPPIPPATDPAPPDSPTVLFRIDTTFSLGGLESLAAAVDLGSAAVRAFEQITPASAGVLAPSNMGTPTPRPTGDDFELFIEVVAPPAVGFTLPAPPASVPGYTVAVKAAPTCPPTVCPVVAAPACPPTFCPVVAAPACPPTVCPVVAAPAKPYAVPVAKPVVCCTSPPAVVMSALQATPLPCCAEKPAGLAGTWYREAPGLVTAVTFKNGELTATVTANVDGTAVTVTLTGDYAVTKDGTVHGIVTGIDVDVAAGVDLPGLELAAAAMQLQGLVDQPFAFRCRPTDGGLMISNLRLVCVKGENAECVPELGMITGIYKPCGGKVPTPKPIAARVVNVYSSDPVVIKSPAMVPPPPIALQAYPSMQIEEKLAVEPCPHARMAVLPPLRECPAVPWSDPVDLVCRLIDNAVGGQVWVGGMTLPSPRYLQHVPQYFPADPCFPLPRELSSQALVPASGMMPPARVITPPCPTTVVRAVPVSPLPPAATCLPTVCPGPVVYGGPAPAMPVPTVYVAPPMPCPVPVVHGGSVPMVPPTQVVPMPVPAVFAPPPPAFMMTATPMPVTPATRSIRGTWYREIGPMVCVIAVKDGHMTVTVTMCVEKDGRVMTVGMVGTADCYPTRDGVGMVGVITGLDVVTEGDVFAVEPDLLEQFGELGKTQKALVGQPFAVSFRIHDDTLMVGNLRLALDRDDAGIADGVAMIAGRYKAAGEKGVPKGKPMKEKNCDGPTCAKPTPATKSDAVSPERFSATPVVQVQATESVLTPPPMLPPTPLPQANETYGAAVGAAIGSPRVGAAIGGAVGISFEKPCEKVCPAECYGARAICLPSCSDCLTLADVVELTAAGASDDVIVTQLQVTNSAFKLSVADIVGLKKKGVTDRVIMQMQNSTR